MIGSKLGKYRLVEKVGKGGMGIVYRAHDENLDRDVALKVLPADKLTEATARTRFRQEAHALSRLNHPNIATIHDFGSSDDVDYLVMELVEGPSLEERIAEGPLAEDEMLRISGQVADAVAEAHEHGIVHRDLKPANLKFTAKGQVKVLDFGLAALEPSDNPVTETMVTAIATDVLEVAGTLLYMAPEQLRGQPPKPTSDVWALGVILYEAVSQALPFNGGTIHEISAAILSDTPAPLPASVSPHLRGVVQRCLQKDPTQRFQSGGEVRVALRMLSDSSIPIQPMAPESRPTRWRLPMIGAFGVIALVLAVVLGWQGLRDPTAGSPVPALAARSVVAVPSTVISDAADEFLAEAIPRTMSNHLASLDGLVTKVPPTRAQYDQFGGDHTLLAKAYGVEALVTSSLTVRNDRFVLSVQLLEVATQSLVWGADFEGARDDYLGLVSDASRGVRIALRPDEIGVTAPAVAQNTKAEFALQRGLYNIDLFLFQQSVEALALAKGNIETAMDLDPTSAAAAAAFAQIQLLEIAQGADAAGAIGRAEMWATRAVRLDERSSQGWQILSRLEGMRPEGDSTRGLEFALKAAAFGPLNHLAHISLGVTLAATSCELGAAAYAEGPRVNPLDLNSAAAASGLLQLVGRSDEAKAHLDRVLGIEPDLPYALLQKTMVHLYLGEPAIAGETFARLQQLGGGPFPPQVIEMTGDLLELARSEKGDQTSSPAVQRLLELARGEGDRFPYWAQSTQLTPAILANVERTGDALEMLEARTALGVVEPYDYLLWGPAMSSLRSDPRYTVALAASKGRFEDTVKILEAARGRNELPAYLATTLTELLNRLDAG